MATPSNWPPDINDLRDALGYQVRDGDDDQLNRYLKAAVQLIDRKTGRLDDPTAHVLADGDLPEIFGISAVETAKLWWQQAYDGPIGGPDDGIVPMGADMPRRVQGWLEDYMGPVFS